MLPVSNQGWGIGADLSLQARSNRLSLSVTTLALTAARCTFASSRGGIALAAVEEKTFEEVLDLTKTTPRDLLLGNGFSMAAHDGFDYRQLLKRASVPDDVAAIFASHRTSNFEAVMRVLLAESVGMNPNQARESREKIEALKTALIHSVHEVHPPRRSRISDPQWARCEDFLEHFIGKKRPGRIFTTNYDLLLAWAVGPDRDRKKPETRFKAYEGFRGGTYGAALGSATIIYLHGALHLYMGRDYMGRDWPQQMQWWATGVALHDQIADHLRRGEFPIFVTEGASTLKEPKSPGFLKDAHTAFKSTCNIGAKKTLFTLGHGLGQEDAHILSLIPQGTVETLCLGAFRRAEMDAFREIANGWVAARAKAGKPPLKVYIFNSEDVVWGPNPANVSSNPEV